MALRTPERKAAVAGHLPAVLLPALLALAVTGCARFRPSMQPAPPSPRAVILPDWCRYGVEAETQYAYSVAPQLGYNTFEVYLQNHSTNTIVFKSAVLNGKPLLSMVLDEVNTGHELGNTLPFDATNQPTSVEVAWWQFYPSAELKPGETIVGQFNFREPFRARRNLSLGWVSRGNLIVSGKAGVYPERMMELMVPRFRQPETLITAITFPLDYSKVYVQYQSRHEPPVKVWLNHRAITNFIVLPSLEVDTPDMLAVIAPFKLTTGLPLHVKLLFRNGNSRQALVRALSGVVLDAYALGGTAEGRKLGLDAEPKVLNLQAAQGGDVACYDVKKRDHGAAAGLVIAERQRLLARREDKLTAIHYCTAMFPALWNIYGQVSDSVYANPYRLGWGHNPARFIEEEEDCLKRAWLSARPRPFLWMPESFKSRKRFLEGAELEVMGWMALVRGAKGIKYMNLQGNLDGYPASLVAAMTNFNVAVRTRLDRLSPLALVAERMLLAEGVPEENAANSGAAGNLPVKVYTAWSGEQGILVMARNLDYRTDGQADEEGRAPRFSATPKNNVVIPLKLPNWFQFAGATDFLTGDSVAAVQSQQRVELKLKKLEAFALIWLVHKSEHARKNPNGGADS